ncbi:MULTISPECIES: hypothetical protein [Methylobacteriaceae]|uniref:hypothetical protein n=1 Tax=Methylobacteriaceae TaxID=119045 RepID=UPI000DAB0DAB|nr:MULTISPECIES: hypothetical protein [Methylobacterium]AWV19803.1 hypothetical protein A3862_29610 [Methylobacterium sp. XJLW]AYO86371.1 hypothetical protein EBB05_28675 [Methylobacterium brachiatum]
MNDRWHTAIHEAGHAVIGRVLTMVCGGASIVADEAENEAGHSITADPMVILGEWDRRGKWRGSDLGTASVFRGRALTVMAGAEAEAEILGQCQGGDGDDRYQVALMLYEIAEEGEHERIEIRLRRAARSLIRRHRTDIERVATALMERETLTGDEIDAMLPPGFMARPSVWATACGESDYEPR